MNFMRTSFLAKIELQASTSGDKSSLSAASKLQKIKEHFRAVSELEK